MTNREMLHKIIKDTFGIVVRTNYRIVCSDVNCIDPSENDICCDSCMFSEGVNSFWDQEYKPQSLSTLINLLETNSTETKETVALTSREISW